MAKHGTEDLASVKIVLSQNVVVTKTDFVKASIRIKKKIKFVVVRKTDFVKASVEIQFFFKIN